jgi:tRNA-specific adenosine deaminase 1
MHPDHLGQDAHNDAVLKIINVYSSFSYVPQHSQWTILASFFLVRHNDELSSEIKIISLATGTKCLPVQRLSSRGEVVHDSHAEVLARRCALRWFLEEICRIHSQEGCGTSSWIIRGSNGKYSLQEGVKLNLYISTVPCEFPLFFFFFPKYLSIVLLC